MQRQELVLPIMLALAQGPMHENSLRFSLGEYGAKAMMASDFCRFLMEMVQHGILEAAIAGASDLTVDDVELEDAQWGKGLDKVEFNRVYLYVRLKQWN